MEEFRGNGKKPSSSCKEIKLGLLSYDKATVFGLMETSKLGYYFECDGDKKKILVVLKMDD